MFFSTKEFSQRGISFDFGEGDGPKQTLILGEFVCDCVHANSPTNYQDHVDSTWDYYTYSSNQVTSGITHPSVAPDGQSNQTYAVAVNGINSDCWINSLFGNSTKPQFPQSVSRRSFGASYFTENFYPGINCDGDYDEPCFTDPDIQESLFLEIFSICDGGIDKARKKIGLYGPGSDTVTFISPTHAAFCAHCVGYGSGIDRTVSYYNPSTKQFETVIIDLYDINYNEYTQRLSDERDIRIGKIRNAGVTFPVYHQYYLNPYSLKEYIQYSGKNLNEKLSQALDVEPIELKETATELVEASNSIENDAEYARNNIKVLIQKGSDAADHIVEIAKQSEHPRAFEVAANLLKNLADMNKDLLEIQKRKQDLNQKITNNTKNVNIDIAVFVGSTAELIKQLRENK
jgi:hypothetical protein